MKMNLYEVKHKYSSYLLRKFIVIAKDEDTALNLAGEELIKSAKENPQTYDKNAYWRLGLTAFEIDVCINNGTYLDNFIVELLIEDVSKETIIQRWTH